MEKSFRKELASLEEVFTFLTEHLDLHAVDGASAYAITLAVEELFTNMVKYSTTSRNDVAIAIRCDDGRITVVLTDTDVEPFDVTQAVSPNVSAPPQQWKPGGLGLHLAKSLVDSVDYHYENRISTITFTKNLER